MWDPVPGGALKLAIDEELSEAMDVAFGGAGRYALQTYACSSAQSAMGKAASRTTPCGMTSHTRVVRAPGANPVAPWLLAGLAPSPGFNPLSRSISLTCASADPDTIEVHLSVGQSWRWPGGRSRTANFLAEGVHLAEGARTCLDPPGPEAGASRQRQSTRRVTFSRLLLESNGECYY